MTLLRLCAAVQLANVLSTEQLFYACILPFIAFFGAFAFIMYPLRETLHPTGEVSILSMKINVKWYFLLLPGLSTVLRTVLVPAQPPCWGGCPKAW